ncbi:MAG: DUF547 domain-containing protein [Candidatus Thiodiazotropha sp.]
MGKLTQIILVTWLVVAADNVIAFDHGAWDELLRQHVITERGGVATSVDYSGLSGKRSRLKEYLNSLAEVDQAAFEAWSKPDQLAFLINAYNAWTVELILTRYPDLDSIKDLGGFFSSPWKKAFIPLFGEKRSLDDIEHGMIRKRGSYNDPRIHFAVNCASIGCPALRSEAYSGERLDEQLQQQTELFLADRMRNRYTGDRFEVSAIFKWYREDFQQGWLDIHSVADLLLRYKASLGLTEAEADRLRNSKPSIHFLDYDWRLNAAP